jgi:adenylate cyclase
MKADLQKRMQFYQRMYGVIPDFRAGFHLGEVTTGEIGTLKKNIIFTGDVLNATARMLELCKYFQTDIVVSDDIVQKLETTSKQRWTLQPLGTKVLRGRRQPVKLWTI